MRTIIVFTMALAAVAQALAAEQRTDKILIQGNPAGTQTVQIESGGAVRVEYSYNDRGRGDHIIATWKLDADGLSIEYDGRGNDYMKAAVEERFEMKGGKASWKNRSEKGDQAVTGKAFYLPLNSPPEFMGVLARALLKAPGRNWRCCPRARRASRRPEKQRPKKANSPSTASPGSASPRNRFGSIAKASRQRSRPGFLSCPKDWSPRSNNC
jgi:hypothetical protein